MLQICVTSSITDYGETAELHNFINICMQKLFNHFFVNTASNKILMTKFSYMRGEENGTSNRRMQPPTALQKALLMQTLNNFIFIPLLKIFPNSES